MRETKHAPKGKRSKKALSVVLSVAGMSLAATAAGPVASMTLPATAPLQPVPLGEEEIADVSLATFHLFDQEKLGAPRTITELVRGGCGGCGHGGGCGGARRRIRRLRPRLRICRNARLRWLRPRLRICRNPRIRLPWMWPRMRMGRMRRMVGRMRLVFVLGWLQSLVLSRALL